MTDSPERGLSSRVLRLEVELDPAGQFLEWWDGRVEDVVDGNGAEPSRSTVATCRFARVHGLVWGREVIAHLDDETQELYEIGERLFDGLDEDAFEDLRELRSSLIVVERVNARDVEDAAALLRSLGRVMDDCLVVLAPEFRPWVDHMGGLVDDEVRLRAADRAWKRAGFRPHRSSGLLVLDQAEFLAEGRARRTEED